MVVEKEGSCVFACRDSVAHAATRYFLMFDISATVVAAELKHRAIISRATRRRQAKVYKNETKLQIQ